MFKNCIIIWLKNVLIVYLKILGKIVLFNKNYHVKPSIKFKYKSNLKQFIIQKFEFAF